MLNPSVMLVDRFVDVEHLLYDEFELNRALYFLKTIKDLADNNLGGSLTLAVNGDWGTGKTSYLKIAESFYKDYLEYPVLFFEAWKYQNDPDYFLSLIFHLRELAGDNSNLKGQITKFAKIVSTTFAVGMKALSKVDFRDVRDFFKEYESLLLEGYSKNREEVDRLRKIIKGIINKNSGRKFEENINYYNKLIWQALFNEKNLDELISEFEEFLTHKTHPLIDFYISQKENIKEILEEFLNIKPIYSLEELKPKKKKLILIIDDLDRLIPRNAFKMIEILRFYFDIEDVIILMGVNDRILEKYINKIYHLNDNDITDRFLEKVFQHSYRLESAKINNIHLRLVDEREKRLFNDILENFEFPHRKWIKIINRALERKIKLRKENLNCKDILEAILEELFPSYDFSKREMPTIHKIEFLYKEYKDMENSTEDNSNKNVILTLIKKLEKDETFTSYPKHILETIFEIYEKKCREAEI